MNTCPAVKSTGEVCGNRCRGGDPRCGTHMNNLINNGPHTVARNELKYRQRAIVKRTRDEGFDRAEQQNDPILRDRMIEDVEHQLRLLKVTHGHEMDMLIREQEDEIRQTGIDPDAEANRRRRENNQRRAEIQRARWQDHIAFANVVQDVNVQNALMRAQEIANQANGIVVVARGDLANFARDNQNVHTTVAVQQTKDMVHRILAIQVPTEYRWNEIECSKTPGDIIMCCKLTPRSAWQMTSKYCQDEDIYEMGKGIYGKVLDGVWQFMMASPDKEDLCRILKQEMEDNIGMCAQGNLTRLCNILAGYMEGVGVQESPAEVLGRKLPMLMEINNVDERLNEAHKLLVDLAIPQEQWLSWVEPLVEGSVTFRANAGGQVIGLMVY
jgi:hypothetical protein